MAQDPAPRPEQESSVDVFEHEMADLERSVWKENRIHPLIVVAGAAVIALCLGGGFLFLSSTQRRDPSSSTIVTIDVREPRNGWLPARPTRFSWESTARTRAYLVTIKEQGSATDLVIRESPTNSVELSEDEAARLVKGGSYVWRVHARSEQGWTLGEGGGNFTF